MFRIRYINGDVIETMHSVASVLGNAFHHAIDTFYKTAGAGLDDVAAGLQAGTQFIEEYPEGFIKWSKTIPDRQTLLEKFAYVYNNRVPELKREGFIDSEIMLEHEINVEWRGEKLELPIKLKGYVDRLYKDEEGRLILEDDKVCYTFSNPDKIDGKKLLQAVQYYFLVYAETGQEPYKMRFVETKYTEGKDKTVPKTKAYDVVFSENELFFDFFLRFYQDTVRALSGEQVFLPNIDALYDNEVGIIAYVHRLDVPEEKAKHEKMHRVENITEVLKRKVTSVRNMKCLESAVERSLVEYKSIDFSKMSTEQKIATKLMEHGIVLHYDSTVDGNSFQQYRFTPSIGVKMKTLYGYAADVEQALGISGVRIIAPIPNTTFVGIEVPKTERQFVSLTKKVIGAKEEGIPIGVNYNGEVLRLSLDEMPHALVAGATGSGKSVFLNALINTVIAHGGAELLLIDPKQVELSQFVSHAKAVGYTAEEAVAILTELSEEMERRFGSMKQAKVRHYTQCGLTQIVCVVDEFADLVLAKNGSMVTDLMVRIAQKGRAAGIHLVIATQRPDSKVISGLIKANFPTKIAFATSSEVNSRIILDENGAEKLLGKGDCLVANPKFVGLQRVQAFNI